MYPIKRRIMPSATVPKNLLGLGVWSEKPNLLKGLTASTARMLAKKLKEALEFGREPVDNALSFANGVMDGFGVETITGPYVDSYYRNINAIYVNVGDPHETTILFDTMRHKFYAVAWGTWVEIVELSARRKMD